MPKLPRVTGKEMARALERAGFRLDRVSGSHHTYISPDTGREATVKRTPKDLPTGTIKSILRQSGLTVEELRAVLK